METENMKLKGNLRGLKDAIDERFTWIASGYSEQRNKRGIVISGALAPENARESVI